MRSIPFEKLGIPLSQIKEGISHFTFVVTDLSDGIMGGDSFSRGLEVSAQCTAVGNDYLVRVEPKAECVFFCDRCGEPVKTEISGQVQTLYTFDRVKYQEANSDDIRLLNPSEQEIDIRQDVIDSLTLSIPAKILCRDDCLGLCPRCGVNLNQKKCRCSKEETDPRWDVLKNIKF